MSDDTFIDAEQMQGSGRQDKISFRLLVLEHVRRISQFASVEFRGGYWVKKSKVHGTQITSEEYYVPDSRDLYCNAVNCLSDMLLPHFDKQMTKAELESDERESTLVAQYETNSSTAKTVAEHDKAKQVFKDRWVREKRILFRSLSRFLFRIRYLEAEVFEE